DGRVARAARRTLALGDGADYAVLLGGVGAAVGVARRCDGARRRLHPFPTRRSSDLVILIGKGGVRQAALFHFGPVAFVPLQNQGDRKSTRLNSSHVKISYAVFCLKKKIGTAQTVAASMEMAWRQVPPAVHTLPASRP